MEVLDKSESKIAAYQPFYAQLAELEQTNAALVFDYESKKGNKEARSHVYAMRKSKTALEAIRKEEKESVLLLGRAIDSEAKAIEARIEAMIAVHQEKIDEVEKRETDRINAIKSKIAEFSTLQTFLSLDGLKDHIAALAATEIDFSFAEFSLEAASALTESIMKHQELLARKMKEEADAAELAELRRLKAEQEQRQRDEAIAKAAAEKATREAAEREAALIAQAEADRLAALKREADLLAKAEEEKEAAAKRELALREQAEAEKAAAIKAEQDKAAALIAERERHQAQLIKEQTARENDTKHKGRINREVLEVLQSVGMTEADGKHLIKLIACGKIPHITINY